MKLKMINHIKYYSSSNYWFPFKELMEIEDERGNYSLEEFKMWKKKYNVKNDDLVIWVTPDKRQVKYYAKGGDIFTYNTNDGFIIPESDDGDDGFVMVKY